MFLPENPPLDRTMLLKELGIRAKFLAVGVERMDYTKGVLERFRGIERFLEKFPHYLGEFVYVQIGAPSRTHIKRYHDFLAEVDAEAERINWKFKRRDYRPIVFLKDTTAIRRSCLSIVWRICAWSRAFTTE
jgi:trehalose-6-phosphate synthase